MKTLYVLFLPLALLLAACSGHTTTAVRINLASFIPTAYASGDLQVVGTQGALYIPVQSNAPYTPNGGRLVDLGGQINALEQASIRVTANIDNTGSTLLEATIGTRVAPSSDSTNIYNAIGGDVSVGTAQVSVAPGKTAPLSLDINLPVDNPVAFNLIKSGRFRVGVSLSIASGSTLHYTLTTAEIIVSGKLFQLISP